MSPGTNMSFLVDATTIREVLQVIQDGGQSVAFAVDSEGHLVGVMTDGDARRALLRGASLEDQVGPYVSTSPAVVNERESRDAVLNQMRARVISQIPIVDDNGVLVGIHTLQGLIGRRPRPNVAVVLAGGRGTRLRPLTDELPKSMVTIDGRPVLERIVTHLVGHGISDIVLAVGHLADPIIEYFGDGSLFGCQIRYLREDPERPLGTCGPLAGLTDLVGEVEQPIVVMNGDLLTSVDIGGLLAIHGETRPEMTLAVKAFPLQVPYAVVEQIDGDVVSLAEKPIFEHVVNIGVYIVAPSCLPLIPTGVMFHMTDLVDVLLSRGRAVRAWNSDDDWIDIGTPHDLIRANGLPEHRT